MSTNAYDDTAGRALVVLLRDLMEGIRLIVYSRTSIGAAISASLGECAEMCYRGTFELNGSSRVVQEIWQCQAISHDFVERRGLT